jgi:glyoxylase-like metal-dependent hydrolase (beta-lactamase superfamily II)
MVYGHPVALSADRYVADGDTMKVGELELKFLHTPGHTPGGMCILAEDVLFSGDTLFEQSIGRTDFPGSSYQDIVKSIREKLFVLPDDTTVLPGHMGATTIGFEKENNPFV